MISFTYLGDPLLGLSSPTPPMIPSFLPEDHFVGYHGNNLCESSMVDTFGNQCCFQPSYETSASIIRDVDQQQQQQPVTTTVASVLIKNLSPVPAGHYTAEMDPSALLLDVKTEGDEDGNVVGLEGVKLEQEAVIKCERVVDGSFY